MQGGGLVIPAPDSTGQKAHQTEEESEEEKSSEVRQTKYHAWAWDRC